MKWGFAEKVIIKSQRQFMYGSNFYESDVTLARKIKSTSDNLIQYMLGFKTARVSK